MQAECASFTINELNTEHRNTRNSKYRSKILICMSWKKKKEKREFVCSFAFNKFQGNKCKFHSIEFKEWFQLKERKQERKKKKTMNERRKIVDIKFQSYLVTEKYCCQKLLYTPMDIKSTDTSGMAFTRRVDWYELKMISMGSTIPTV